MPQILDSNSRLATINFKVDGIGKANPAHITINSPGNTEVCIPVSMTKRDGEAVKANFYLTIEEIEEDVFGLTWRLISVGEQG